MKKAVNKKLINKIYVVLLMTLLIALCIIMPISYGRYLASSKDSASASISNFIISNSYENNNVIDLSDFKPGESRSFVYEVYNYNDSKTCEVRMSYSIEVKSFNVLPLVLSITPNESKDSYADVNSSNPLLYENGVFEAASKEKHTYTINITWDENITDNSYSGEIDAIKIIIIAKQIVE